MTSPTAMHQLGHYIVRFQGLETLLNEILILLADVDDQEIVTILVHELEFGRRVATADVLFAYVVRTRFPAQQEHIKGFHLVAEDLVQLSKVRNAMVHSRYDVWMDITGRAGMIRSNSRLKPARGARVDEALDMLPEAFQADLDALVEMVVRIEKYRLVLIDWLYPDV